MVPLLIHVVDEAIFHLSCDLLTTKRFVASAVKLGIFRAWYLEVVFASDGLYGAISNYISGKCCLSYVDKTFFSLSCDLPTYNHVFCG